MIASEHLAKLRDLTESIGKAHGEATRCYELACTVGDSDGTIRQQLRAANDKAAVLYWQRREAINAARKGHVSANDIGQACRIRSATVTHVLNNWHIDQADFLAWRLRVARDADRPIPVPARLSARKVYTAADITGEADGTLHYQPRVRPQRKRADVNS